MTGMLCEVLLLSFLCPAAKGKESSNSETSMSDNMEKVSQDDIMELLQQRPIAAHGSFSAHETIQIVMTSPLQQTQAYIVRKLMNPFINL